MATKPKPATPKPTPKPSQDTYAKRREMYNRLTPQQKADFRNEINAMADSLKRERQKANPPKPSPPPTEKGLQVRRRKPERRISSQGIAGFRKAPTDA